MNLPKWRNLNNCVRFRIVCRTGFNPNGPTAAVVVVGNRAGVTRAQEKFHYKAVELTGVYPPIGPQSGGTRLYLKGSNLNIGSQTEIMLDDLPCTVERSLASNSQISCRTTRSPVPSNAISLLVLRIDGANVTFPSPFTYTSDPTLRYIHPLKSFMRYLLFQSFLCVFYYCYLQLKGCNSVQYCYLQSN